MIKNSENKPVLRHVCYYCYGGQETISENPRKTDFCEKCGHRGEGQGRLGIWNNLAQFIVID